MAARWHLSRGISVALADARPRYRPPFDVAGSGSARMIGRFGPTKAPSCWPRSRPLGRGCWAVLVDDAEELLDSPLEAAALSCPLGSAVRSSPVVWSR
jgi:hypothetical protein